MGEGVTDPAEDMARQIVDLQRKVADISNSMVTQSYMPGDLIHSYATSRPGSLPCDGSGPYLNADYPALGAILSTNGTDFNTPDHRGLVIVGTGTGTGLTLRSLGVVYGTETTTLTAAQSGMPSHNHTVAATTGSTTPGATGSTTPGGATTSSAGAHTHAHGSDGASYFVNAGSFYGLTAPATTDSDGAHTHTVPGVAHTHTSAAHTHTLPDTDAVAATNAAQAHSNMQPSIGVNIFIKT